MSAPPDISGDKTLDMLLEIRQGLAEIGGKLTVLAAGQKRIDDDLESFKGRDARVTELLTIEKVRREVLEVQVKSLSEWRQGLLIRVLGVACAAVTLATGVVGAVVWIASK